MLTVRPSILDPGCCWASNNDRKNEGPASNQNNPHYMRLGCWEAEEEDEESTRRNDLQWVEYNNSCTNVNLHRRTEDLV
jgi:hypothetical protein